MSLTKSNMNNYIISNFIARYLDKNFKFSIVDIMPVPQNNGLIS